MVHLTDSDTVEPTLQYVRSLIERRDLDSYLAALIVTASYSDRRLSPLHPHIELLLSEPPPTLTRPHDVAVAGCRLALGDTAILTANIPAALERELRRVPMPPAATVRDDDRLLLGVAAGVGTVGDEKLRKLVQDVSSERLTGTVADRTVALLADLFASGSAQLREPFTRESLRLVEMAANTFLQPEDAVAAWWAANRLLDAEWQPTTSELEFLEKNRSDLARSIRQQGYATNMRPLFVSLHFDADAISPSERLVRRSALDAALTICDGFVSSAAKLQVRRAKKPTFVVADEYDVQDLFHALVLPFIPDCEPEDPTPKVAGKSSRLDFVSKKTGIGFEMKYVRDVSHAAAVRNEILIDEATYEAHPYVQTVVVFVFDPKRHMPEHQRLTFEADLSGEVTIRLRKVSYIVRVRG